MSFPLGNIQIPPVGTIEALRGETNLALNRIGSNFQALTAGLFAKAVRTKDGSYNFEPNFPSSSDLLIPDNSITTAKLVDSAVVAQKIANNAITVSKIMDGAVDSLKLANEAVTEAKIAAEAVKGTHIAADTIQTNHLAAGAVSAEKIVAHTITAAQIAALTITADEIAANSIVAGKIAVGAIEADNIQANAVTANKIFVADLAAINANLGTITAGVINANLVTVTNLNASNITTGFLSADRIAANSIVAGKLSVATLSAISANLGAITAGSLNAVSITAATISSGTIDVGTGAGRFIAGNTTLIIGNPAGNRLEISTTTFGDGIALYQGVYSSSLLRMYFNNYRGILTTHNGFTGDTFTLYPDVLEYVPTGVGILYTRYTGDSITFLNDTNIYRAGANHLKTDDALEVTGILHLGATIQKTSQDGYTIGMYDGDNTISFKWDGAALKVKIDATEMTISLV
jgi:hypothetical protein